MRKPDEKKVLHFLKFIQKVLVELISIAGWIKILFDIFT